MDALDGNAIAGQLMTVFGIEMTTAAGICGGCGARAFLAECSVYRNAPGVVSRCRNCSSVLMVLVVRGDVTCVDLRGLAGVEPTQR